MNEILDRLRKLNDCETDEAAIFALTPDRDGDREWRVILDLLRGHNLNGDMFNDMTVCCAPTAIEAIAQAEVIVAAGYRPGKSCTPESHRP